MPAQVIFDSFPQLSDRQRQQISALNELYADWNAMINVISRKDMDQFYVRHVLHSMSIAKVISFKPKTRVLDVGTGGGFPGIPLAILFPEVEFHLVDSIGKKIKVVQDVAEQLELDNVQASQNRVEELPNRYHFITNRAVAPMAKLVQWVGSAISQEQFNDLPNGILSLKGGDLTEELAEVKGKVQVTEIAQFFDDPFFETKQVVFWSK